MFMRNQKINFFLWILYIGWSDFEEEKKCYTFYVVPNCCWTPNPKFQVLMMPLSLVAGPQKIWTVTPQKKLFEACNREEHILWFFKGYKWRDIKRNIYFVLVQIKNSFAHFWKIKTNTEQKLLSNFLFVDCSLIHKEGLCKFSKKY